MLERFGIFVVWMFNVAALICAAPAVIMYGIAHGHLSDGQTYLGTGFLAIAAGLWFLGRALRYVFVGLPYRAG
jgi:hypothetical protein